MTSYDNTKKITLEEMSKEDLLKRYKTLLTVAQKAKEAKDELVDKNAELKQILKNASHSSEVPDTLTQQKLHHIMTIEELQGKNTSLSFKLAQFEETNNKLDIENISYQHQVKRLTDENEQFMSDLDLLAMQVPHSSNKQPDIDEACKLAELQKMLSISFDEIKRLNLELVEVDRRNNKSELTAKYKMTLQDCNKYNSDCNKLMHELQEKDNELKHLKTTVKQFAEISLSEMLRTVNKLRDKLKVYNSKIIKLAINIKALKEEKNSFLTLFKDYVVQVEAWKDQLSSASAKLLHHLKHIKLESVELHKENKILKEMNRKMMEVLEAHKTDDEKTKELDEIESIKSNNLELRDEIANFLIAQEQYKRKVEILSKEKETISKVLEAVVKDHNQEKQNFDNTSRQSSFEHAKVCIDYQNTISKLQADAALLTKKTGELMNEKLNLQEEHQHSQCNETQFANESSDKIIKLVQGNDELLKKLGDKSRGRDSGSQTEDTLQLHELVKSLKRENFELLTEMNEMNQALKERGETISKLEVHCDEVMKKLQIYETQANKNVDIVSQKEEIIRELEKELKVIKDCNESTQIGKLMIQINHLESELENVRERSYADSEVMSTSTISQKEEANQMKDLEGSWEERYGKLRNLALKLKRKIKEITDELKKEQIEKSDAQQKNCANIKIISTLQSQSDKLQDELEVSTTLAKEYLAKLNEANSEILKYKGKLLVDAEEIQSLKKQIEDLYMEKNSTDVWKIQIGNKVQTLRKELEANKDM